MVQNKTTCSDTYFTLYGHPLNKDVPTYEEWLTSVHPEDRETAAADVQQAIDTGSNYIGKFRVVWPDQSIHWLKARGKVYYDDEKKPIRMIGVNVDSTAEVIAQQELVQHKDRLELLVKQRTDELVSQNEELTKGIEERHKAEASLRESEARLKTLIDGVYDVVFVHDLDGNILDCNSACIHQLGYSKEEFLTMNTHDIDAPHFAEGFKERLEIQLKEGRYQSEGIQVAKDGTEKPVNIMTSLIQYNGKNAILSVCRDMTTSRKAERERRYMDHQIQQAQKLESLGVLAGGIAHDFNNLLMGVLGSAELAMDHITLGSPAYRNVKQIETSAKYASDLCRQMLDYAGKGRFVAEMVNLNILIEEIQGLLETTVSKKATLVMKLEESLPGIEADVSQVRQIVMNLISNAAEALDKQDGEVTIITKTTEYTEQDLRTNYTDSHLEPGTYVAMEISDDGSGMTETTLQKIFDPFFTTKFTGRGLGLAAVQGIVRSHKGAIRVQSQLGKGTTFKILFPASQIHIKEEVVKEADNGQLSTDGIILLVDDEETIRLVVSQMLEGCGLTVETCCDGEEAVDYFQKNGDQVACVLMDLTMPGMGGQKAFQNIRAITPEAKVIFSSGYNEQDVIDKASTQGMAGFIQKPYQRDQLVRTLQALL